MLDPDHAQSIAETWLHEAWAARRRAAFTLPPSRLAVEPGDMIETHEGGLRSLHRVTAISDHGPRAIEALSIEPAIYEPNESPVRSQDVAPQPVTGQADAYFLDLPIRRDDGRDTAGYAALHQAPWPGTLAIYRSPGADGYTLSQTVEAAATVGALLDPMPAGAVGRIDYATRVRIELASGELTSVSRLALLEGANALGIKRDDGSWEVCQFESAELVGELTYELSGWLRGQAGTDDDLAIGAITAAADSQVVLLDDTVTHIDIGDTGIARPFSWRFGPVNRDVGHASYAQAEHAFQGLARRPYAPVHVRADRNAAGDLTLTWIRRTRIGGDNWEQPDVVLGEASEAYEVDIVSAGEVVRTLATSAPRVTYSAVEQTADFGTLPAAVTCRVHQLSATWGRGKARVAIV